jgi:hypothetical protein
MDPPRFNVTYNFELSPEDAHGGNPYRILMVNNCSFMKLDGTFVNTAEELQQLNQLNTEDLIIVRRGNELLIPDPADFNDFPEFFDPTNPRANVDVNEPYKITNITKGEIENLSAQRINVESGGKRKRKSKRRKQSKRRRQSKRRKFSKRMY